MKQFLLQEAPFEKAVEGFWLYANNWRVDEPEELDGEGMDDSISFKI
ncbi:hypothetical protein [Paenibacillus sp. Leaf72]|nr:hypothetical protein [Paenibacillus sp. Leaf72]